MAEDNSQNQQQQAATEHITVVAVAPIIPERTFVSSIIMEVRNASEEIATKLNGQSPDIKQG
jgi:hypothetical protein